MVMSNAERQKRFRERRKRQAGENKNDLIEELWRLYTEKEQEFNRNAPHKLYSVERFLSKRLKQDDASVPLARILYKMLTNKEPDKDKLRQWIVEGNDPDEPHPSTPWLSGDSATRP